MKTLTVLLSLLFTSSVSLANVGGDEVRNGGGISEQYLAYALKTMDKTIAQCLRSMSCARDPEQRSILIKIKSGLPLELDADILQFTSNQKRPGLFTILGVERLAVTADYVGAPIYYNVNMLYSLGKPQISFGSAIQTLIHELGHHHGIGDHDALEKLGSEVRSYIELGYQETNYYFSIPGKLMRKSEIKAFTKGTDNNVDQDNGTLEVIFKNQIVSFSSEFQSLNSQCDEDPSKPILRSIIQFFNLHWDYKADEQISSDKYLSGNVWLYCRDKYSRVHKKNYEFTLKIKTAYENEFVYKSHELVKKPTYLYTENVTLPREARK